MNGSIIRFFSLMVMLLSVVTVHASLSEKCPSSLAIKASGIQPSLSVVQYRLELFASESPDLISVACMSNPGACVKCYYHDNQIPADSSRIHTLNYQPAVSFAIDGVTIHDLEVAWFNTVILNQGGQFGLGIYLNSFTKTDVKIKAGQAPYLLKQTRLVDAECKPTIVADSEQPCATVTETVGSIQDIQIK